MLRLCTFWIRPPSLGCQRPIRQFLHHLVPQREVVPCPSLQPGLVKYSVHHKKPAPFLHGSFDHHLRSSSSSIGQSCCVGRVRMYSNDTSSQEVSALTEELFYFGKFKIDHSEVFLVTEHSFGFVNLKPVVPDVLVSPRRVVHRFLDLTSEEASDLWLTAKRIGQKLEPFYKATSLTFAIQDGPQAGQTVPHVHVHILPRKGGDFEKNDEIYDKVDDKEKELSEKLNLDEERKDRTFDEMAAEAAQLRALF